MPARQETRAPATVTSAAALWQPGPARPALADGAVHVWRAQLDRVAQGWLAALSEEELLRAERFPAPDRGRLWARSRAAARVLLARYAGGEPAEIELMQGPEGRLWMVRSAFSFSLSHSGALALYAFAASPRVGVDLETGTRMKESALARRLLGRSREQAVLALEPGARRSELLRAWVRREALLKCRASDCDARVAEFEVVPGVPGAVAVGGESTPSVSFWDLG